MNPEPVNANNIFNVSIHLRRMAEIHPHKRAVVYPAGRDKYKRVAYSHLTFQQLDQESDYYAYGLEKAGIKQGTRTVLMVKPSIEFFALTFAIFKVGAVPVVVDPGMGISRMLRCLEESRPNAFIGIPIAHALRKLRPKYFKTVKTCITIGRRWLWGGLSLKDIRLTSSKPYNIAKTRQNDMAAILFTTGSTGPAKGVVYTHGTFDAQIKHIKSHFNITSDEIDLPTFPLFALFDQALGMTAIIPDMDPTKPGFVNPEKIIEPIMNQGVTNMFASPALLNRVGRYCENKGITLPSLKRVISAGAPVSPSNIARFALTLSDGVEIHTPYGATEAMPVISIASKEILSETAELSKKGFGICIGRPVNGLEVRIIEINDNPINEWSDTLILKDGDIGEITVSGALVTKEYFRKPKATALSKIKEGNRIWHRMGDLGWIDKKERIWFCGRKNQRVITKNGLLFTIPCEAIFNNHPMVFRSALVGVGSPPNQKPVICIELEHDKKQKRKKLIKKELFELAKTSVLTKDIETILFRKAFPVDIRHNSKIFREKLALWAQKKVT
ncbi:MAG: AMP-binding protein [Proteobacteria bacterium]|nr:AMP-binding protein [Desulfobacteraceae bacterium]MBU3980990.1 AMP-binding protein [Pseudomonadota bacterium]MBU4011958.1 AMP-binding protein [Pseudomonadota bacterium]MBU4067207.1 AMP-binding protein [Pseudomonadota bacterium]MBU4128013.1 AMP-binding protein [Pseudomonadota bacterium]